MASIKKIYHNWTAYNIDWGVTSVNNQTWAVTVSEFTPWSWTAWQVVTKTANGYEYADAPVTSVNWQTGNVTVDSGITKIFTLSSTSDLTNAQAAYDWYVSGGNPIIRVSPWLSNLYLWTITSTTLKFTRASSYWAESNGFWAAVTWYVFTISSWSVTAVTSMDNYIKTSSSAPWSWTSNNTITFVI